ncbi:MAG: hypothetical protein WCO56_02205 [Verrucomicrobiota bacterium]
MLLDCFEDYGQDQAKSVITDARLAAFTAIESAGGVAQGSLGLCKFGWIKVVQCEVRIVPVALTKESDQLATFCGGVYLRKRDIEFGAFVDYRRCFEAKAGE